MEGRHLVLFFGCFAVFVIVAAVIYTTTTPTTSHANTIDNTGKQQIQLRQSSVVSDSSIICLNVGGKRFETTIATLKSRGETNKLVAMVRSPILDQAGCVFIDRDPEIFQCVMHYLRQDKSNLYAYSCIDELEYFGLSLPFTMMLKKVFKPLVPLKNALIHELYPRIEAFYRDQWSLTSRPVDVPRLVLAANYSMLVAKMLPFADQGDIVSGVALFSGPNRIWANSSSVVYFDGIISPPFDVRKHQQVISEWLGFSVSSIFQPQLQILCAAGMPHGVLELQPTAWTQGCIVSIAIAPMGAPIGMPSLQSLLGTN